MSAIDCRPKRALRKVYQNLENFEQPKDFRGRSAVVTQLWWIVQDTLFRMSPQFLYGFRRALLRAFGARIGRGVIIRPTARVTYPWKLKVGNNSWIGDFVELYTLGEITIGENSVISQKSYLCCGTHNYRSENFDISAKPINIGNQVWIAGDVFIHPGVTIGDGAVVAARSTVTGDLPGLFIYEGNPARPIKGRIT